MPADAHVTEGQRQALAELSRIAAEGCGLSILCHWTAAPWLWIEVSIDCSDIVSSPSGIKLRSRERFKIGVRSGFPLRHPIVWTPHRRWAGTPHVQWGRSLCLYVSPSTEWDPSDGMAGFLERLVAWLKRAAVGELDGPGEPIHPPVAYPVGDAGSVVVRANAPRAPNSHAWLGWALLRRVHEQRVDLVGWMALGHQLPVSPAEARVLCGEQAGQEPVELAPAIILPSPLTFEYPDTAAALLAALAADGVSPQAVFALLGLASMTNARLATDRAGYGGERPTFFVVGTPMRGIVGGDRLTHLAAWRLQPLAAQIGELVLSMYSDNQELTHIGEKALEIGQAWLDGEKTEWARVLEDRPEIVTKRDHATGAQWLRGKKVLILGAGALGAHAAEACVRGGAQRVVIADQGLVHPGILVRQPYIDADIGRPKSMVLAEQLRGIRPDVSIDAVHKDIVECFDGEVPPPDADLVIDATANRTVRVAIERHRSRQRVGWPALSTLIIGHEARRGIATVSHPGSSGAGLDVLRRLGLAARADRSGRFRDIVEDFYRDPPRAAFQPEPGCSDATFVGSYGDVIGLAGQMCAGVFDALLSGGAGMSALIVRMPTAPGGAVGRTGEWMHWGDDLTMVTSDGAWEVRVSSSASAEMRAEARRGARVRTTGVETGGLLLGCFDSALGVVWVDEATGPPLDSRLSSFHFEHGLQGVEELIAARRDATARVTTFVGMWHTHPGGVARPSPTDECGMRSLVLPLKSAPPRALMLIAGGKGGRWSDWLAENTEPDWHARVVQREAGATAESDDDLVRCATIHPGLVWPGGFAQHPVVEAFRPSARLGWVRWLRRGRAR